MKNSINSIVNYFKQFAVTIITVAFGLQLIRVLLVSLAGYLRDSVGVASLDLAPIALGIFSLSFLAGIIWKYAGPAASLWISAGGVAVIRLAEQLSTSANLDYYLSAAGVVLFLMYIPKGLALARDEGEAGSTNFGFAFIVGMATDTAIHIGARTLDLSWQSGPIPIAIVAILAVASIYSISKSSAQLAMENHHEGHWSGGSTLFALGPWMLLQMLVFQNVARMSSLTGWETPIAGAVVVLGNALGLALAASYIASGRNTSKRNFGIGFLLTASLLIPEPTGFVGSVQLLVGHVFSIMLAMSLFAGFGKGKNAHGIARSTIANGLGKLVFVILAFVYYVTYDISFGFNAHTLLPVLAVLITIGALLSSHGGSDSESGNPNYAPAKLGLAFILVPLVLSFFWISTVETTPSADNKTVKVMSYNLHNGVNTSGTLDLEALAKVIEESGADVVGLQEVSRGWLIWGSADMLTWLSQRLDMPYFYGPTGDAQWGNAILSKYPIVSAENILLDLPEDMEELLLRRGYIKADIDVGGGTLTLINTHYTHIGSHDTQREIQSSQIIEAWGKSATTVFMGDLNAEPDKNAIIMLVNAGLIDIAAEIGEQPINTYYSDDESQIDYIFVSDDLSYVNFNIPQTNASDHYPLVVTITLP